MKTYKLTPLEKLKMEKSRLREERGMAERRMSYQFKYLSDNWGVILTKGITSSIRNRISGTVENISSAGKASAAPFVTKPSSGWKWTGLLTSNLSILPTIAPMVWNLAKPALIAFATKKATSLLFGRSKAKK